MPLSIGPFPNRFPVGPYPTLYGPSVSPAKVLLDIWDPSDFSSLHLCSTKLPVGPRSCWTFGNKRANTPRYPCSLPTGIDHYKDWTHSLLFVETKSFSQLPLLLPDSFCILRGTGPSSSHLLWTSRLRCHGDSFLLSFHLCRIKQIENSSCSAFGHPLQDLTHLHLDCSSFEPLRRAILGTTFSIFDLGPDLGAWPDCWVSVEFLHAPIH